MMDRTNDSRTLGSARIAGLLALAALAASCVEGSASLPTDDGSVGNGTFGVTDGAPFMVTGPQGGPFPDGSRTYTLVNYTQSLFRWDLEATVPWLTSETLGGALGPMATSEVTLTLDPAYAAHGRILTRIAEVFPDIIVAGDQTQPVYGANLAYDAPQARSFFNASTGFGTLGYGLPAAFGAKLAAPDRKVISLIGDGGFQFTIAELATGIDLGLPVPILLWNNHGYGEITSYMRDRQIQKIGVDIYTPDFQAIARGFGAEATTAHSIDDLVAKIEAAFLGVGPMLIEINDAAARNW